ncbi:MAG: methyltransferase, partial [Clostridia bacterium]|nr:methyltransferase [Clostridia bacterium]
PGAAIWAVDYSEPALQVAKLNAKDHHVEARINWYRGSYFDALHEIRPKPHFNLIISNPPYLSREEMAKLPKEVKEFEPVEALDGGEEGLDGYRLILDSLPDYIQAPGLMLFEIGAGQQKQVESLCAGTGLFRSITWCQDLAGHPRVLEGVLQQPEFKIIIEE